MMASSSQSTIPKKYRRLSIHLETRTQEKTKLSKKPVDPVLAIRQIDIHLIPPADVLTYFSTSQTFGLENAAVQHRSKNGKNVISPPRNHYWKKVLNYVFGGFNFLMWVAFIVTLLSYQPLGSLNGETPSLFNLGVAILLLLVIFLSTTFYAIVDWHASRIMKSIKHLVAEETTVIRDGKRQIILATNLVIGDIVILSMGDRVPADLRVMHVSSDLKFDRSLLTGESDVVSGEVEATALNALETRNLALSSTFVVQGTCTGVVFAIGDRSVMGLMVAMSGTSKFKLTTVQNEVWFFSKIICTIAFLLFCVSILTWGFWLRPSFPGFETASGAIINSIGCLTAFVPQGLPICVALSLTISAKRMAKQHVLVKNLATIETLGCMSVLCSDKTGTITEGKMSLNYVAFLDREFQVDEMMEKFSLNSGPAAPAAFKDLHMVARLCNGANFDETANDPLPVEDRPVKGDATDTAILRFAEALSIPSIGVDTAMLLASYEKLFEIPFNSRNKWMLTVVCERATTWSGVDPWMLVKGAPDVLLLSCTHVMKADGTTVPLDDKRRAQLVALQEGWSAEGQRVLALCHRQLAGVKVDVERMSASEIEEIMYDELEGLTLVGLVGLRDPPRCDVKDAIAVIRKAGVKVFMVTGDFELTAVAIAKQVGIITQENFDTIDDMRASSTARRYVNAPCPSIKPSDDDPIRVLVLTGDDIETMIPDDWDMLVGNYTEIVFARTTPEQKLRIVREVKARGDNTVAVTGDGVNDAPAMKAADIGVAMGSGSDVAKEAAAMILLNNELSSIPVAIEMGRLVFDNLKKVILYLMPAGSYTAFMAVFANVFLGMQPPLSSYLQICFSIANDVVMSVSLMYELSEADLMLRKPRNARTDRLTNWKFFFQIYLFMGLMMWPCAMGMWFLYMSQQGLGFYDVILVYNKWTNGYKGYTTDQLTHFVQVGQCIYYVTMVFLQYGGLLAARNRRVSLLVSNPLWGPRRNIAVPLGMFGSALIAVANLYYTGLQRVFLTTPIPGMFWGIPVAFGLGVLMMDELRKLMVRTYPKSIIAKTAW